MAEKPHFPFLIWLDPSSCWEKEKKWNEKRNQRQTTLFLVFSVTCVIVSLTLFFLHWLGYSNDQQTSSLVSHLAFNCFCLYLGMSMFNMCMPMLHNGLQVRHIVIYSRQAHLRWINHKQSCHSPHKHIESMLLIWKDVIFLVGLEANNFHNILATLRSTQNFTPI